jgi:hypothetical protein
MAKIEIEIPDPEKAHKEVYIALDFDGVIAHYDSWEAQGNKVGKPVKYMVSKVKEWLKKGYKVSIFTARLSHSQTTSEVEIQKIQNFLKENGLPETLQITCLKMYYFTHFVDDRAYHVIPNTGVIEGNPEL